MVKTENEQQKYEIVDVSWHRNGIGGAGFYAVLFRAAEHNNELFIASIFDEPGYCAVYRVDLLAEQNVKFGENSWRGDQFQSVLKPTIEKWLKTNGTNRLGPFSL